MVLNLLAVISKNLKWFYLVHDKRYKASELKEKLIFMKDIKSRNNVIPNGLYKLFLYGDRKVGKTSLRIAYCH